MLYQLCLEPVEEPSFCVAAPSLLLPKLAGLSATALTTMATQPQHGRHQVLFPGDSSWDSVGGSFHHAASS